jgi:hypothetical protein
MYMGAQTPTELPYSTHIEPAEQGGEEYERCLDCGNELLTMLGGFDRVTHREECQHYRGDR